MRTLLKEGSSVVPNSSMGNEDKWIDLKDRIHGLGDLDQGDKQEADPGFMGPEAYGIGELFQK